MAQGSLYQDDPNSFTEWKPTEELRQISEEEAFFSRGFLQCRPEVWFSELGQYWLPLLHTLEIDLSVISCKPTVDFPQDLEVVTCYELSGERQLLGIQQSLLSMFSDLIVPNPSDLQLGIVFEYLVRRLLASLNSAWRGEGSLHLNFLPHEEAQPVEVVAAICLRVSCNGERGDVWFGLGPQAVEFFDIEWRRKILEERVGSQPDTDSGTYTATIEICELAVPPIMVIDYVRSNSLINLEIPLGNVVKIRIDGEEWARGVLCQYNGNFAVEVLETNVKPQAIEQEMTSIRVKIAESDVSNGSLAEYTQRGAILLTNTEATPLASLIISGEDVAKAVIGQIDGQFALSILPKDG